MRTILPLKAGSFLQNSTKARQAINPPIPDGLISVEKQKQDIANY
jgi:hypothetical protein